MRKGVDQTVAWVLALLGGSLLMGIGYGLTDFVYNKKQKSKKIMNYQEFRQDFGFETKENDQQNDPEIASRDRQKILKDAQHKNIAEKKWSYRGDLGPAQWGDLHRSFQLCKHGQRQSPVALGGKTKKINKVLDFKHDPVQISAKYTDQLLHLTPTRGSRVTITSGQDLDDFELKSLSLHVPGEHLVEDSAADAEIQWYYQNSRKRKIAIAVLVYEGKGHRSIGNILESLPEIKGQTKRLVGNYDFSSWFPKRKRFYYYKGSQTIPPCTEGLDWYVLKDPIEISPRQMDELVRRVRFNARPPQPIHNRIISNG